jgi:hypothetical protein
MKDIRKLVATALAVAVSATGLLVVSTEAAATPQTVSVPSDGSHVSVNVGPGNYTLTANGTYLYGSLSTQYADASYFWGDLGDCAKTADNNHNLLVDGASPWLGPCSNTHTYQAPYVCTSAIGCTIDLQIADTYYPDNSGSLSVTVTPVTSANPCPDAVPGVVLCVAAEGPVVTLSVPSVNTTSNAQHQIAGYVDSYRFALVTGGSVTVPCVTLTADATSTDACALAGGVFVSRIVTLVNTTADEPELGAPSVQVSVCSASLTATVLGFGATGVPVYTVC